MAKQRGGFFGGAGRKRARPRPARDRRRVMMRKLLTAQIINLKRRGAGGGLDIFEELFAFPFLPDPSGGGGPFGGGRTPGGGGGGPGPGGGGAEGGMGGFGQGMEGSSNIVTPQGHPDEPV